MENKFGLFVLILMVLCGFLACDEKEVLRPVERSASPIVSRRLAALPASIPSPVNNPLTEEKVKLGKLLFFDPILSGNQDVSCATCHHPTMGYAENIPFSIGVNGQGLGSERYFNTPNDIPFVKRNSQTILNTAYNGITVKRNYDPSSTPMFWDMRASGLEDQALEPIKSFEEMRGHGISEEGILDEVINRLNAIPEYRQLFQDAFGDDAKIDTITLAQAIASFERTLVTNNSRFDQYMRGDEDAISLSEKEGLFLFKKSGCDNCHNGPMFSDYKIHVLGVPDIEGQVLDNGFEDGQGFRTPTLRNLNVTRPYMHNGSLETLLRVLEFYEDISGSKMRNPKISRDQLDPLVDDIELSVKDMRPIISFLNTLNDTDYDREIPESVPSGLKVGGN